ncbi:Retrotransposon gag domain [Sesbania bispinosa]|nr:Retrotransposon gag domain [Sesbania bispinosa]
MAEITAGLQGLQQVVQQLVGVVAEQQQGNQQQNLDGQQGVRQVDQQPGATTERFIDGLERLWRALGCSDIRAVELASFQLEGVAYDWFDTVTRGRSVGSPPLAWGEFSRLFMARFLGECQDGLAHEFERLEQTEGMSVSEYSAHFTQLSRHAPYPITERCVLSSGQKRKKDGRSDRDSRKKQRIVYHRGVVSSGSLLALRKVVDQIKGIFTDHFSTAAFGVTSTPCPTCHIRRDCPVAVTQPSSSYASAPTTLASSQAPSAPVRQFGGSYGRGYEWLNRVVKGLVVEVRKQIGRGQAGFCHDSSGCSCIQCSGKELFANLIALDMVDFDVILGMDWLASHYATLDCHNKVV